MTSANTIFNGEIVENYDKYMGPLLFEPFADDIVKRISSFKCEKLIEIACGTGILTQKISEKVQGIKKIYATDINSDMLNFAKTKFSDANHIIFQTADAGNISFEDNMFDIAVCQFGVMFFPDKPEAFKEIHRILKPGGMFIFNAFDAIENNQLFFVANNIIKKTFPYNPPDFYNIPFSFNNKKIIKEIVHGAGFNDIQIDDVTKQGIGESAKGVTIGLVRGEPIYNQIMMRDPSMLPNIVNDMEITLASRFNAKPLRAEMNALVCSCKKAV